MKIRWFNLIVVLGFFAIFAEAVIGLEPSRVALTAEVERNLTQSGVSNPVTAVLLNFRSYDTLLEMGVLLLAVCAAWTVGLGERLPTHRGDVALNIVAAVFVPLIILGAAYFLWKGAYAPGGAFQGGAILAGGLILLMLAGRASWFWREGTHRFCLSLGLIVFLTLAAWPVLEGRSLLQYPVGEAKEWILAIEMAALISIGFTVAALLLGGRPVTEEGTN